MEYVNIENLFLNNLLRIGMLGVSLILVSDYVLYPQDRLTLIIDVVILSALVAAYLIRKKRSLVSVLTITSVVTAAMLYQGVAAPTNTTTSLAVLLVVGFILSVFLKGPLLYTMHALVFIGINVVFVYQANNPLIHTKDPSDVATVAVTFTILYFMLTYATYLLKAGYDRVHGALRTANVELQSKANEIEAQNEELMQAQDNLSTMNTELERLVVERTERLRKKTETLIRYSYSNAHHLRGPVARLMGLVAIRALDKSPDNDFFFAKVREQAEEIDKVVRQINTELGDL
jgi:hypothetical protein